ncbi:hypothetical protein DS745_13960 [Anaerobacillus alkaliphilus]|uniref:ATP-grasp domain-containing protein n=1 Tax=Anaerobacillus alkaliphilus TaxID=1548597 RepID=A0A4Q0VT18_9BACI|nr:ATP-grasp domain-containing protein [Anaerobacillus alkaliphilus]RXI99972.1 hypothetical protein DS745_13960 [Anaerobacillus alkaliphilus]
MPTNRPYLSLIQQSVKNDGVTFEEITPNYLYKAVMNEKSFLMHDVEVGLNNSAAAKSAMSKSGTFDLLQYFKIPAVEHVFLMNNRSRFSQSNSFHVAREFFIQSNEKVVLKQNNGSQGSNVYKITSLDSLDQSLQALFDLQMDATISPYYEASFEYRIVTLNGEPMLWLAKERTTSWKHNLISGAKSIDVPQELLPQLSELAEQAAKALELNFCTVDILETSDGLRVLELNEQVMLDEYCKNNTERQKKVSKVYREALLARFNTL